MYWCRKKTFWGGCLATAVILVVVVGFARKTPCQKKQPNLLQEVLHRAVGPLSAQDPLLLRLLRDHHLDPPSHLPYNLSSDALYQVWGRSLTFPVIHRHVRKIFEGQPRGFFVEAGALDGEFLSNSLYLEKTLGWEGLLVEPDPINYRFLLQKRRKAWTSMTCLSGTPFARQTVFQSYQKSPLYNFEVSWMYRGKTHELEEHSEVAETVQSTSSTSYSKVQCFPLSSYLAVLNVSIIDFFSLDVQGTEVQILETFPWEKVTVRVLAVEHYAQEKPSGVLDPDFVATMRRKGFRLLDTTNEPDYIFLLESDPHLKNIEL